MILVFSPALEFQLCYSCLSQDFASTHFRNQKRYAVGCKTLRVRDSEEGDRQELPVSDWRCWSTDAALPLLMAKTATVASS
jgi:hypothetical protein